MNWLKLRPMLLCSLALHGLVLAVPMTSSEPQKQVEKAVKVVALPNKNQSASKAQTPKSSQKVQVKANRSLARPKARLNRETPVLVAARTPIFPTSAAPAAPAPASVSATPLSATTPTSVSPTDPFADFPQYANATAGSLGLFTAEIDQASQQTIDRLTQVATFFQTQLPAKGFTVKRQIEDGKRVVYQVSKAGVTQVLNLIDRDGQGTVIVLTDQVLDNPANVTLSQDVLVTILSQYMPAETEDFADPTLFYQQPGTSAAAEHPDTEGGYRLVSDYAPQQLLTQVLQTELEGRSFQIAQAGQYGGGMVYEVSNGSFKRYLNLVPSKQGVGTVIVLWERLPG